MSAAIQGHDSPGKPEEGPERGFGPDMQRVHSLVLGALAFAFLLRVVGQLLVAFFRVDFLPPMAESYSGLVPYRCCSRFNS